MTEQPQNITRLLESWRAGDEQALDTLTPLIYNSLKRISAKHLKNESQSSIQATELVNEAFIQLAGANVDWQSRAHFFAIASRAIRRLLIDRAKAKKREKRGGGIQPITLCEEVVTGGDPEENILALDEALERLAAFDQRKSDILELCFFGGLSYQEIAEAKGISLATVDRELRFAKAWMANELK